MTSLEQNNGGNKRPHPNIVDKPDLARALEWRAMQSDLSPGARLIIHVVAKVMASDGEGCHPSIDWIAEHTGQSIRTTKRHLKEVREWREINIISGQGRSANAYKPAFDYDAVISEYIHQKRRVVVPPVAPQAASSATSGTTTDQKPNKGGSGARSSAASDTTKPVVVSNWHPTNKDQTARQDRQSIDAKDCLDDQSFVEKEEEAPNDDQNVVAMNSGQGDRDALERTLNKVLVEPFGSEVANAICQDIVKWSAMSPMEALSDLSVKIEAYGSLNLFEAWQSVRSRTGVRSPGAYFYKSLAGMAQERGRRDMPSREKVAPVSPRQLQVVKGGI